jgi:hypothetical protein
MATFGQMNTMAAHHVMGMWLVVAVAAAAVNGDIIE